MIRSAIILASKRYMTFLPNLLYVQKNSFRRQHKTHLELDKSKKTQTMAKAKSIRILTLSFSTAYPQLNTRDPI
ncbi:hypothetical protein FGO68_gene3788 [Halteria grandinella]|uniref:Uncharacterized protein n=1 Tax=Halteria grandinella TaxID=5974 RepID=A0A8J8NQY2_HALGN|nr:hypothetical protein FGO68_gene3788 [Halteria grandinella]